MAGTATKLTTTQRGRAAEDLAAAFLQARGYVIVQRNFRCPGGEIDLIGEDNGTLCFIEVRARDNDSLGHPLETIGRRKVQRLVHAAHIFLESYAQAWPPMRFDVVAIVLSEPPQLSLLRDAFQTHG